jgi:hypothetical protein
MQASIVSPNIEVRCIDHELHAAASHHETRFNTDASFRSFQGEGGRDSRLRTSINSRHKEVHSPWYTQVPQISVMLANA